MDYLNDTFKPVYARDFKNAAAAFASNCLEYFSWEDFFGGLEMQLRRRVAKHVVKEYPEA